MRTSSSAEMTKLTELRAYTVLEPSSATPTPASTGPISVAMFSTPCTSAFAATRESLRTRFGIAE